MPEAAYLHIRGSEADATRVVTLTGESVRVGRGGHCEVRLVDPDVAEVQCILRRRGESWHVQPVGPSGLVSLDGRPVDAPGPIPRGATLRVGAYRIEIRAAEWGSYDAPIEVGEPAGAASMALRVAAASVTPGTPRLPLPAAVESEVERVRRWQARLEQRERSVRDRQEEKRWEDRWRSASEGLRAKGARPAIPRVAATPAPPGRPHVDRPATPARPVHARVAPSGADPTGPPKLPPATPADPDGLPRRSATARPDPARPAVAAPRAGDGPRPTGRENRSLVVPAAEPIRVVDTPTPTADPAPMGDAASPAPDLPAWVSAPIYADASPTSEFAWHPADLRPVAGEEAAIETVPAGSPRPGPIARPRETAPGPIPPRDGPPSAESREFPSVAAILAAQGTRAVAEPPRAGPRRRRPPRRPIPTDPVAPDRRGLPAWLVGPPATLVAAGLVGGGLYLGMTWSLDNLAAGVAARASRRAEGAAPVPLDPADPPEALWWKTTAGHMAEWAAAIERSPEGPERAAEVRALLEAAGRASPLRAEVRYALAGPVGGEEGPSPSLAVGLGRDVVSQTRTARSLERSGKRAAALVAYRRALELAVEADPARLPPPAFDDDPQVRRYRLPREGIVAEVVRDILGAGAWGFDDWSGALPPRAVARLAAGRTLRERSSPDAGRALAMTLDADLAEPTSPADAAEHHAARAEAMAILDRRAEAVGPYRLAIDLATDGATRRRWRFNLAEVLATLGAPEERDALLEAARSPDPADEVSRRAGEARRRPGLR